MSLFSKLFGKSNPKPEQAEPETYQGFRIYPEPVKEGGKYRVAARIEKEVDGALRTHNLIRADVLDSHDAAISTSVAKARQMIDEQGERLFR